MTCTAIPADALNGLNQTEQAGLGYRLVSVELNDGRTFDPAVLSEGCIIQVRGYEEIPLAPSDIKSVRVSNKRWNFRRHYRAEELRRVAASA